MGESLPQLIAEELARPAAADAALLAGEICRRHGAAVAAVMFYGSCLRKGQTREGVLDFYVLVDSYRAAYRSRLLAWSNALLPPNVFYLEQPQGACVLRSKYAVISTRDFSKACLPASLHASVWARFAQPSVLAWARDRAARQLVSDCLVEAALTMVGRMVALLPARGCSSSLDPEQLWQLGFAETYRAELRPESPATISELYQANRHHYDRVALAALQELERRGKLSLGREGRKLCVIIPRAERRRLQLGWALRRRVAKALYFLRLVKSALTFGDWVPYALWKLGRHTGVRIEISERQRRHPLIWGWPVIFRLLRQQNLR